MNKYGLVLMALVFCTAVSCDLEEKWNAMKNGDPTKGTEPMSSIELGKFSKDDSEEIILLVDKFKTVDYGKYTLLPMTSIEKLQKNSELSGVSVSEDQIAMMNVLDYDDKRLMCRLSYEPFVAKITKVTVTSSDEDIVSFEETDDLLTFRMNINSTGECDVKVVAEGINSVERNYHFRVTAKVTIQLYTEPFWQNMKSARLKYKTKSLPRGVSKLYLNVRDSATVIGFVRVIDQRKGDKTFRSVTDTTTLGLVQHTDKFRIHKRVLLRDVTSIVRKYNSEMYAQCYIRLSEEAANTLMADSGLILSYSVKKVGKNYELSLLGSTITMDAYQVHWINRTIQMEGQWPYMWKVVTVDGVPYLEFLEPYMARQLQLGFDVIGNSPYLVFDITLKENGDMSGTDEDEDDFEEDFFDSSEEVVDSLGNKLKDYFIFHFIENLSQHKKDSLSRVLDDIVTSVPDSTKWQLGY